MRAAMYNRPIQALRNIWKQWNNLQQRGVASAVIEVSTKSLQV
jgi:hypothetical protein